MLLTKLFMVWSRESKFFLYLTAQFISKFTEVYPPQDRSTKKLQRDSLKNAERLNTDRENHFDYTLYLFMYTININKSLPKANLLKGVVQKLHGCYHTNLCIYETQGETSTYLP